MFFVFDSIPDWYNTQEMCGKVVSEDIFLIVYCADDSLAQLILIPDCFVTSRMIKKKLFTALHADENVLHFNEDSNSIVFNYKEMGILNIHLNSINLDENFDGDNPDTTILIRLLAWHIKFEKRKKIKKYK